MQRFQVQNLLVASIWEAVTALSEHFSLFMIDISLQYMDLCFCYEVLLLYRLLIILYCMAIQLC